MSQSECNVRNHLNYIQRNVYHERPSSIMMNSAPSENCNLDLHQARKINLKTAKTKCDLNIDLNALQKALCMSASFLHDSGYSGSSSFRSFVTSSCSENDSSNYNNTTNNKKPGLPLYGTGWMVAENLSDSDESLPEQPISSSSASVFATSVLENISNVISNKKIENKKRSSRDDDYCGLLSIFLFLSMLLLSYNKKQ